MPSEPQETGIDQEPSRYVTVFHQLKETEDGERGDRLIVHGEHLDDRYVMDDELEDFVPVARPIAVIDAGVEMEHDDLGEWCNSHAGKAILNEFFPDIEPDDPTLRDVEEYLDDEPEIVTDGGQPSTGIDQKLEAGEMEIKVREDKVSISYQIGEVVGSAWGETFDEALRNLADAMGDRTLRPNPSEDRYVWPEERLAKCPNCGDYRSADHHAILSDRVVECSGEPEDDDPEIVTDGGVDQPGKEQSEHIYSVRLPGFSRWTPDYSIAFEMAVGVKPENWNEDDPAPGEDRITIKHKRGREYVLDLSDDPEVIENQECCLNQRYDCGHIAFGPPKRLPPKCPECHPTATDGGTEQCKRCKDPIEGEPVIMLHGRFPMHGDCYDEVIGA